MLLAEFTYNWLFFLIPILGLGAFVVYIFGEDVSKNKPPEVDNHINEHWK